jgi:hypothetical protein
MKKLDCLALVIVVASSAFFVCGPVIEQTKIGKYDFASNYVALYAAKNKIPFYDPVVCPQGAKSEILSKLARHIGIPHDVDQYLYSPAFAVIGCLLPTVPYNSAKTINVWIIGLVWLIGNIILIWSLLPEHRLAGAIFVGLATIFPPALFGVYLGQLSMYVYALILLTLLALRKQAYTLAGIFTALAMLCKTHVGLFLLYFLVKRKWAVLISALCTLLFFVGLSVAFFGFDPWVIYVAKILPKCLSGMAYYGNQSVHGFLARLFIDDPRVIFSATILPSSAWLSILSAVVSFSIIGTTIWHIVKVKANSPIMELSCIVLALLLANRVAFIHHFVWAYFSIIYLWSYFLREKVFNTAIGIVLITGTALLFLPWHTFFHLFIVLEWPRQLGCNTFFGTLLLWFVNLWIIRYHSKLIG